MKLILALLLLNLHLMAFSLFEDKEAIKNEKLTYVSSLTNLIIATQKTRGLTNSFNNGNVAAQLLVYGERKEMKEEIKYLLNAPKGENSNIKISDAAYKKGRGISNDLMALNKNAFKDKDSAKIFSEYTNQINELLAISSNISSKVFKDESQSKQFNIKVMFKTILPLSENIGKARGMGAGIVARKNCKDEEVDKMKGFVKKAKLLSAQLQNEMKTLKISSADDLAAIKTTAKNIDIYLTLIEENVIGKKDIQLDANDFFNQGTSAISNVLGIYKINQKMIEN